MARTRKRKNLTVFDYAHPRGYAGLILAFLILTAAAWHYVLASDIETEIVLPDDLNFHVRTVTTQFFLDNDAPEMIPVIRCESNFKHFEPDGTPLKNLEGSSAIGVAQILSSVHPDPKIVARYNQRFDMDVAVEDFDITTLEGNLGYALVLHKVRGTRDWECGKKFSF